MGAVEEKDGVEAGREADENNLDPIQTLGACPRIDIFSEIEAFIKNKHRHIHDMTSIIF